MNKEILSLIKKYLICFAIMGVFTVGILLSDEFFHANTASIRFLNLSDAFSVPGLIMLLFGVLVWISTTGFFDSISYVAKIGLRALLPFMRNGEQEKYYDYKMRKEGKRLSGYSFIMISGAVYLAVGVVFTLLFFLE